MPGFPIRTPWDHSSVDSSPRPIAASHVLHRLLVPRHPPFALTNLTTKMLASTVQFSNNTPPTTHTHHHTPQPRNNETQKQFDGRWHRPETTTTPGKQETHSPGAGLFFQDPTGCLHHHTTSRDPPRRSTPTRQASCTKRPANQTRACDLPVSPPYEHPESNIRRLTGFCPPHRQAAGGRCSLERR